MFFSSYIFDLKKGFIVQRTLNEQRQCDYSSPVSKTDAFIHIAKERLFTELQMHCLLIERGGVVLRVRMHL